MTLDDALALRKGDHVISNRTMPKYEPIPVTAVHINDKRTIVNVRLNKIGKEQWLDATGYELPPTGKIWCRIHALWEWTADHRRNHPEYYQQKAKRDKPTRGAR